MTRDSSEDWCDGISARAFRQPLVLEGAAGFSCRSQLQRNVHMHRSIGSSRAAASKAESRIGRSCLESVSLEVQPQRNVTFIQSYTSQYNSLKRDAAKLRWTSAQSCSEYETRGGWCSPSSLVSETKIAPSSFLWVPRRRGCKVATLHSMAGPAGDRHSADELQTNSRVTTEQAQNVSFPRDGHIMPIVPLSRRCFLQKAATVLCLCNLIHFRSADDHQDFQQRSQVTFSRSPSVFSNPIRTSLGCVHRRACWI
jgi:hypothetical protein